MNRGKDVEKIVMTTAEAAEYMGMTPTALIRRAEVGRIAYEKREGNNYLFSKKALDNYKRIKKAESRRKPMIAGVVIAAILIGLALKTGAGLFKKKDSANLVKQSAELIRKKDLAGAEHALKVAIEMDPENVQARLGYARLLGRAGKMKELKEQLDLVLKIDPESIEGLQNMGAMLVETGKAEEGRRYFEKLLALNKKNYMAIYYMALIEEQAGNLEKAESFARELMTLQPRAGVADKMLADIFAMNNKYDSALKLYEGNADKGMRETLNQAITLHKKGDVETARKLYMRVASGEKLISRAYNNLAWELVKDGKATKSQLEEAYVYAYKAALLNQNDATAADTLGWTLHLAGRDADALKQLERAAKLDPKLPDPPFHIGRVYVESGDKKHAAKYLKIARALSKSETDRKTIDAILKTIEK